LGPPLPKEEPKKTVKVRARTSHTYYVPSAGDTIVKDCVYEVIDTGLYFKLANCQDWEKHVFEVVSEETPLGLPPKKIRVQAKSTLSGNAHSIVKDTVYETIETQDGGYFVFNGENWSRDWFEVVPDETPLGAPPKEDPLSEAIWVRSKGSGYFYYAIQSKDYADQFLIYDQSGTLRSTYDKDLFHLLTEEQLKGAKVKANDSSGTALSIVAGEAYLADVKPDGYYDIRALNGDLLSDGRHDRDRFEILELASDKAEAAKETATEVVEIEPIEDKAMVAQHAPKKPDANPFGLLMACIGAGSALSHLSQPTPPIKKAKKKPTGKAAQRSQGQ
jgi:hypothetical protein